jgi:transcriptional regulator with XRE-family HTH domain
MSLASDLGASVGERLRERRRGLGLTLKEAAREAEISTSYLSSIETGNSVPSLPILARVVGVLGFSLNEVLRNVGQTVLRTGRLEEGESGVHRASHEDLLLEVAFVVSGAGETGACPVPTMGHEIFVYVLEGALEVVVAGDGLRAPDRRLSRRRLPGAARVPVDRPAHGGGLGGDGREPGAACRPRRPLTAPGFRTGRAGRRAA